MESKDLSIRYSFGGSRDAPLVSRRVEYTHDPAACSLQEALLGRTERMLHDLCAVFDAAKRDFDSKDASLQDEALQKMMGAVTYATKNILSQSFSVHYALMFTRIQEIFERLPVIEERCGVEVKSTVSSFLAPTWNVLKLIDSSFSDDT